MANERKLPGLVEAEKFLGLRKEVQEYFKKIYGEICTPYDCLYYNGDIEAYKGKVLMLKDTSNILIKDCIPLLSEWHLRQILDRGYCINDMCSEPQGFWVFKIEDIEEGKVIDIKTHERDLLLAYLYVAEELISRELELIGRDIVEKGLHKLIREMYNLNKNTEYRIGESSPFGSYTRQSFIGRVYAGISNACFSEITDIDKYLSIYPAGANMLFLASGVSSEDLQIYDHEYKGHRVKGDYLILETKRGEKKLKLKNTVKHNFEICKGGCGECKSICVDKISEDAYVCRHTAKKLKAVSEDILEFYR